MLAHFTVLDTDFRIEVDDVSSEAEARDKVTTAMAKRFVETFRITAITPVRPKKRTSLFSTYADGFRTFLSRFDSAIAE